MKRKGFKFSTIEIVDVKLISTTCKIIAQNEIKRNSTTVIACLVLLNLTSHVSSFFLFFFFLHKLFSLTIPQTANASACWLFAV